jgi:rRNA maturation protein Nop10
MPFCRKCGRRLVEYSESCPDCGTSTTAPIINLKKGPGSGLNFKAAAPSKKIAKAMIPESTIVTVKTIPQPPQPQSPQKATPQSEIVKVTILNAQAKVQTPPKKAASITQPKNTTPARAVTPTKPPVPPKPVLSAKHIVKPKRAVQVKPRAPFSFTNARPVATFTAVQHKPAVPPKPAPIVQPKPTPKPAHVASPAKPAPAPKPVTPAPVYPPHEIIKTKVSLKEDILANPHDYETQTFDFDLECPHNHFWPEGSALPVSKGKAYCLQCGERLRKPKPKKRHRRRRYLT